MARPNDAGQVQTGVEPEHVAALPTGSAEHDRSTSSAEEDQARSSTEPVTSTVDAETPADTDGSDNGDTGASPETEDAAVNNVRDAQHGDTANVTSRSVIRQQLESRKAARQESRAAARRERISEAAERLSSAEPQQRARMAAKAEAAKRIAAALRQARNR